MRRFLALLDADMDGSIESVQQAMWEQESLFCLRRTREALVAFPPRRPAMSQSYGTRLIDVDLPIARISAHARREKTEPHQTAAHWEGTVPPQK